MNELNIAHSTWDPEDAAMFGQPRSKPLLPISDEDRKQLEIAWNDPTFYNLSMNEPVVTAGAVPKRPTENARYVVEQTTHPATS